MTVYYANSIASRSASPAPTTTLRVVIPGGEGHLGRILARHLSRSGHTVTTFTRATLQSPTPVFSLARRTVAWDGRTLGPWVEELQAADVVINLAGRSVDCRYHSRNRQEILASRVESTRILGLAMQTLTRPPRLWLNASTATIYRDSYDRDMDEAIGELGGAEAGVPASWRFSVEVAKAWEDALCSARTPNTRKIPLRAAMVMSAEEDGVFRKLVRLTAFGLGGPWGSGNSWMSWIHESDFCRAIEFLMEREDISGPVNLAGPHPLQNRDFLAALRSALGVRFGLPASRWMLALGAFFLRTETELLLKSRRVVPGILLQHGFEFSFPNWPDAAVDLVKQWRERRHTA